IGLDFIQRAKRLPPVPAFHFGTQNAIPGLRQRRVLIAMEPIKGAARALQHQQLLDAALDLDAASAVLRMYVDDADVLAIAVEAVWVWLAVDVHAAPAVLHNADMRAVDVRI